MDREQQGLLAPRSFSRGREWKDEEQKRNMETFGQGIVGGEP